MQSSTGATPPDSPPLSQEGLQLLWPCDQLQRLGERSLCHVSFLVPSGVLGPGSVLKV
jgi:hypothetical protein